jgi:hypothetical protein
MLTTDQKGSIAESAIAHAAIKLGCAELDRCYFLPLDCFARRSAIQLRLSPTRNNQRLAVNWADAYAFDATLEALLGP